MDVAPSVLHPSLDGFFLWIQSLQSFLRLSNVKVAGEGKCWQVKCQLTQWRSRGWKNAISIQKTLRHLLFCPARRHSSSTVLTFRQKLIFHTFDFLLGGAERADDNSVPRSSMSTSYLSLSLFTLFLSLSSLPLSLLSLSFLSLSFLSLSFLSLSLLFVVCAKKLLQETRHSQQEEQPEIMYH